MACYESYVPFDIPPEGKAHPAHNYDVFVLVALLVFVCLVTFQAGCSCTLHQEEQSEENGALNWLMESLSDPAMSVFLGREVCTLMSVCFLLHLVENPRQKNENMLIHLKSVDRVWLQGMDLKNSPEKIQKHLTIRQRFEQTQDDDYSVEHYMIYTNKMD